MKIERPEGRQPIPPHAKKVFSGVMFDVYQWEQELFDGSTATFEKLKRPDTVVVFPATDDGKIILTKQKQPGWSDSIIGGAGGRVDSGEGVLAAAKRELREETGYAADTYELWYALQPVSKIDWAVFVFVAKGIRKVGDIELDAGEEITLVKVSFAEFVELARADTIHDRELVYKLLEAKDNSKKMKELKRLFGVQ